MKLYNVLKNIILESNDSYIINSIKNRNLVTFYYNGDDNGGKGLRVIEPYCLGVSKAGHKVLRAWDIEGASHTAKTGEQPLPGWRLFRVDKILSFRPSGEKFNDIRPGYNLAGDRGMVNVIINAKFDDNEEERLA